MRNFVVVLLLLAVAGVSYSQTARLQVIHNAADPAAASVDVYVNGTRLLDDFQFRTATPFIDVPADVTLDIGVAPGTSVSAQDTIKNFKVQFASGKKYVAIANGVVTSGFSANPDNRSIEFSIFAADRAREKARWSWFVDLRAFHGATDAPTVGLYINGTKRFPLTESIGYGSFTGYQSLMPRKYTVDVTAGGPNNVVATFNADLSGLRGGAATVFASGFLNPSANQDGPAFGLFAALPNGQVVELPQVGTARLQVIHNAADPAAASVDIYVNGDLLLDNFAFRAATPFIDVPAGVALNIAVAPPTSTSASEALATIPVTLSAGRTYVAVANGVLNPGLFAANPDSKPIGFQLFARDGMRETGKWQFLVDIMALHGASDAPTVDIKVRGLSFFPLFNDLTYGEFSKYLSVPAFRYVLQVTPGNSSAVVAEFLADLRGLKGKSALVFASGFLNPAANQNGPAFGLFAALPNGQVVALPALSPSAAAAIQALTDEEKALLTEGKTTPVEFALEQNYPNPFNPTTTIAFTLPEQGMTTLKVYNAIGQEVAELVNGEMQSGTYSIAFDASNLPSGLYYYRIMSGSFSDLKKMMLVK